MQNGRLFDDGGAASFKWKLEGGPRVFLENEWRWITHVIGAVRILIVFEYFSCK